MKKILNLLLALTVTASAFATEAKQNRGLFAFVNGNAVQVSWRMRATDDPIKTSYELYADGTLFGTFRNKTNVRVNLSKYRNATFKVVVKDAEGKVIDQQDGVKAASDAFLDIPLNAPVIRNANGDKVITCTPMDCSAYDMDGDGEQEIILKWEPSDLCNTSQNIPGNEFFDCYKLNGTRLWRIDMGQNSVAGNNMPFMCWDFDGDGKGELIVKSAPGTKDATGKYVGEGLPGYPADLQTVYYRGSDKLPTKGEEWITCFDGVTGKELASRKYWPYFGIQSNWYPEGNDGVGYGRRGNGLKGAVMKIPCRDGVVRPVCVMQRGAYSYSYALAVSWNGKELVEEWRHSSASKNPCLQCDLFGDWREELVMYATASNAGRKDCDFVLRIMTTTYETDRKLPWLRDDNTYNMQIACQNVGYSQPPHLGYNPFEYYASLGKMEENEIVGDVPGGDEPAQIKVFTPDPAKYYYIKVNDGIWVRFAEFKSGYAQSTTSENLVQFIPAAEQDAYFIKSSDNFFLRDNGNYGFGAQTEQSGATSYIGTVHEDGKVSFKSTKTYTNGNVYITYDSGRTGISRGSSADDATHFIVVEAGTVVDGISESMLTPSQSVIYSISEIKSNTLRPGVNIIHTNDGKVVKVTGNK